MSGKKISDIPKYRKLREKMEATKLLLDLLDPEQGKILSEQINKMQPEFEELSHLPDRFNNHFLDRGWIATSRISTTVVIEAIKLADSGDIDQAEQILVEYYSPETIKIWITYMNRVPAFKSRTRLLRLALIDYEEGRYHACIPVVLSLMDGIVNELYGKGFFARDTKLEAWDSIAAHETGLAELVKRISLPRQKTYTESISLPYRHGILHGNDLGYDNQLVAAKTWAMLLAIGEWAILAVKGELEEPPPKPIKSFQEIREESKRNEEFWELLQNRKRESVIIGKDVPKTGLPEDYKDGSPEKRLVEFLTFWKQGNFGDMANYVSVYDVSVKAVPHELRKVVGEITLLDFEITEIVDYSVIRTDITVRLEYLHNDKVNEQDQHYTLLYGDNTGGSPKGYNDDYNWYIVGWQHMSLK